MNRKGNLIIFSGFAGSGKGTIMKGLLEQHPDLYGLSISATTRAPRPGEEDGREYFFKTKEEFQNLIKQDFFIEHAQYVGNYYGTPKDYVNQVLESGKDVILEIETQGALQVKQKYPDTLLLFVTPPSVAILRDRLVNRGTETPEVVESRMQQASKEAQVMEQYDYLIINDVIEESIASVHEILQAQHFRVEKQKDLIQEFQQEFQDNK